jgi:hypothetical protein
MLTTDTTAFTFRGEPALMQVMRNNGSCWGRISFIDRAEKFDVNTRHDWYDYPDDEAIEAFIRAARNPRCVSPAQGWL